jgi:hypothetical protein
MKLIETYHKFITEIQTWFNNFKSNTIFVNLTNRFISVDILILK